MQLAMPAASQLVTLLSVLANLAVRRSAASLIVRNRGISVRYGRSQFVQPADLTVDRRVIESSSLCTFAVLSREESVGSVWPETFSCRMRADSVRYFHLGSRRVRSDVICLQLRVFTDNATLVEFVDVAVEIVGVDGDMDIVRRLGMLNVRQLGGLSEKLDQRIVQFEYNRTGERCEVMYLTGAGGPPYLGTLTGSFSQTAMSCDDLIKLRVQYKHLGFPSPDVDYLPFYAHVVDAEGAILRVQYFWITVKISAANTNVRPSVDSSSLLYLTVSQFVPTAIPPTALQFNDPDNENDNLIIQVAQALKENEGSLVHVDRPRIPIRSFRQREIRKLKIVYRPPSTTSFLVQQVELKVVAIDPYGAESDASILQFYIQPVNTNTPVVTLNTGLVLLEGQSRVLSPERNLQISDKDSRQRIIVTAINGPIHGRLLVRGRRTFRFTIRDLDSRVVVYEHDHSDSRHDDIMFSVSDKEHMISFLFQILVEPIDDEPPMLTTHTIVTVLSGGYVQLGSQHLNAHDDDSEYSQIKYVVQYSSQYLRFGLISKHSGLYPSPTAVRHVQNFTQADVNEGRIYYEHSGHGETMDLFAFRLADTHDPPNYSDVKVMLVSIRPADIHTPRKSPRAIMAMEVDENGTALITKQHLLYIDADSDDRSLVYEITRHPYFVDSSVLPAGQLIRLHHSTPQVVSTFTQAEVNHYKVSFRVPRIEIGTIKQHVTFEFKVKDPGGNSVDGQHFNITINPVNSQAPQITTRNLRVAVGKSVVVTVHELYVTDRDTEVTDLVFRVDVLPKYGHLYLSGKLADESIAIKITDIKSGRLTYIHGKSSLSARDRFVVSVTDGKYTVDRKVDINVAIPAPPFPFTIKSVVYKTVNESGNVSLLLDDVVTSINVGPSSIAFKLIKLPDYGHLKINDQRVTKLNYKDLDSGSVFYVHSGDEIGTETRNDSMQLAVVVNGILFRNGSDPVMTTVLLSILPIDDKPPEIVIKKKLIVDEGGKIAITTNTLTVTDPDSLINVVRIHVKKACRYGFLENTVTSPGSEINTTMPVKQFLLADLIQGTISYVQSVYKHSEHSKDRCKLIATDGDSHSLVRTLKITIRAMNDEPPRLSVNNGSSVKEGGKINMRALVKITDLDTADDHIKYVMTLLPRHGAIVHRPTGSRLNAFTQRMVTKKEVEYQHDDSESMEDEFRFRVTDGTHTLSVSLRITVIPVDDLKPQVIANSGLVVRANETKVISSRVLQCVDMDTDDRRLVYVITETKGEGFLQLRSGVVVKNLKVGMSFSQDDLLARRVMYVHSRTFQTNSTTREYVKFTATDGLNPLTDVFFFITVLPKLLPDLRVVNKLARVRENSVLTITTDLLSAVDGTSDIENIKFSVTRPPEKGRLESSLSPGIAVITFRQIDLVASRIRYIHTSDDVSVVDGFVYRVTNGYQLLTRTFVISIDHVDDSLPVVESNGMTTRRGQMQVISVLMLRALDADTEPENVTFVLHRLPENGDLMRTRNGRVEIVKDNFTQFDVDRGLVKYRHTRLDTSSDSFQFTVTDGVHSKFHVHPDITKVTSRLQLFEIVVESPVNHKPVVTVNTGIHNLRFFGSATIGAMMTSRVLNAEVSGKVDDNLVYSVFEHPAHGQIVLVESEGYRHVNNFTQNQLGTVAYILMAPFDRTATSDSFIVDVVGSDGSRSFPAVVDIQWTWIWIDQRVYEVGEDSGSIDIDINRSGNVWQSSFINIAAVDQTAHRTVNFFTSNARLMQFDPGEKQKTWRVGIINDGVEMSRSLTFDVSVSNPVNALIFPGDGTAKVVIHDATRGITG